MPKLPTHIAWLLLLGMTLLAVLLAWHQRPMLLNGGLGYDGRHYHQMTVQYMTTGHVEAVPPWVNRWGAVALAGELATLFKADIRTGYAIMNYGATLAIVLMLGWTLRKQPRMAALGIGWWLMHHLAPLRFTAYDPYNPDTMGLACLLGAFLLVRNCSNWQLALGCILALIGATFREFVLVLPIAILGQCLRSLWKDHYLDKSRLLTGLALLAAGMAGTALARGMVVNVQIHGLLDGISYHVRDVLFHLLEIRPLVFIVSASLAYGPVLFLFLYQWPRVRQYANEHPLWTWVTVLLLVLSYVGGTDSERYLLWLFPWLIMALASNQAPITLPKSGWFWVLLVAVQSVASRWWWPIPQAEPSTGWHWPIFTSFNGANPFLLLFGHHAMNLNYLYPLVYGAEYVMLFWVLWSWSSKGHGKQKAAHH